MSTAALVQAHQRTMDRLGELGSNVGSIVKNYKIKKLGKKWLEYDDKSAEGAVKFAKEHGLSPEEMVETVINPMGAFEKWKADQTIQIMNDAGDVRSHPKNKEIEPGWFPAEEGPWRFQNANQGYLNELEKRKQEAQANQWGEENKIKREQLDEKKSAAEAEASRKMQEAQAKAAKNRFDTWRDQLSTIDSRLAEQSPSGFDLDIAESGEPQTKLAMYQKIATDPEANALSKKLAMQGLGLTQKIVNYQPGNYGAGSSSTGKTTTSSPLGEGWVPVDEQGNPVAQRNADAGVKTPQYQKPEPERIAASYPPDAPEIQQEPPVQQPPPQRGSYTRPAPLVDTQSFVDMANKVKPVIDNYARPAAQTFNDMFINKPWDAYKGLIQQLIESQRREREKLGGM